ncbi:hypothetical protein [Labrys sp. WJW]|uniref:hypothetical protein n=1 Tax=Labrys sp. WJW TaxID=1737983 RepID=UPI0012EA84FA|nr:hypothetical protein [Labrys sp. WJW]
MSLSTAEKKPLEMVVKKLTNGNYRAFAQGIGVSPSTVSCWNNPERRADGLVGTIPMKHHAKVFDLADRLGIPFSYDDLLGKPKDVMAEK